MPAVLRFVALSGIGWLLDLAAYMSLVIGGIRVFWAGLAGALCGATFAFLSSNRLVFKSRTKGISLKLASYLIYTLVLVVIASAAIDIVTQVLIYVNNMFRTSLSLTTSALIAKCLVTPGTLAMNFIVSKHLLHPRTQPINKYV